MKKYFVILVSMMLMSTTMSAQSLLDNLKSAFGSKSTTETTTAQSALTDLVTGLISKTPLNGANIVGTWTYQAPYVAFESDNMLNNTAANYITEKVEQPLTKVFDKAGIRADNFSLTFDGEGNLTIKVGQREIAATYAIDGANLTIEIRQRQFVMNVKQVGETMQIAMNSNRLLTFLTSVAERAASVNANFATVSQLISQYKEMYIGMQFAKK